MFRQETIVGSWTLLQYFRTVYNRTKNDLSSEADLQWRVDDQQRLLEILTIWRGLSSTLIF